jgi:hypothetical protein
MRTFLMILATTLIVGLLYYIAGGYITGGRISRDSNYAQLLWLTSIDRELHAGRYDRAQSVSKSASDMTLQFLPALEDDPNLRTSLLMTTLGGFQMTELNEQIATRAKRHFLPISNNFSEQSRRFLTEIVEVELPASKSSCPAPKKE